jgi:hypothetical protein
MKKTIGKALMLYASILLMGSQLFSSEWEFGVKAGMVRSEAGFSRALPYITLEPINELSFGTFLSYFFIKDQLGLQPEINYSTKGFDVVETDQGQEISSRYKISYIEIPVLISYRFPLRGSFKPGLVLGPYFGFTHKVREVQTAFGNTEKRELDDNLEQMDIGLVFGGNIRYRLGSMSVIFGVRYSLGLVNISKDIMEVAYDFHEDDTIKNRAFTISLGIAFLPQASR